MLYRVIVHCLILTIYSSMIISAHVFAVDTVCKWTCVHAHSMGVHDSCLGWLICPLHMCIII